MSGRCVAGQFDCGGHTLDVAELQPGERIRVFKKLHTIVRNEPGLTHGRRLRLRLSGDEFTVEQMAACSCMVAGPPEGQTSIFDAEYVELAGSPL